RGYWILSNASGQFFGIGSAARDPIWVEINIAGEAPHEGGYNFWQNACSAQWKSGAGQLACPGTEGDSKGFIIPVNNSHLEDGTMGPAPSLLISPENKFNGYIQGTFPTFTVQPGDHFVSVVGCEYGYSCYVTFRLDYMTANGGIFNFWSWREKSDNQNYMANVDLSPLAGRSVRFILTILTTGNSTGDRVRWGAPSIVRGSPLPITVTPVTITPIPTTVTPAPGWLTYTNSTFGFQFNYPPQSERFFETDNSVLIKMPITPGTNLVEKYLQVNARVANPCQSPLSASSPPGSPTETVVINGISFLKQTGGDAGAGNLHEWVAYSTLKNNDCISIDFVLHSLNPDNFATPIPVFDKAAESAVFAQVMSTFTWSSSPIITPTFTPTATQTPASPVIVPSPDIGKLFMNTASIGWAINNTYVLRTMDGGVTWYNVTPSGVASVRNGFFRDSNKGWILTTDSVYRTTNAGLTWARYSVPFNGRIVQFLDDLNGFALSGEGIGMNKNPVSLYQTSDGGATWTLKFAHDPNLPTNGLPVSGYKNGMTFRNTTTGWIGGESPANGIYIYKTINGGTTWSQQPLTLPAGNEDAITSTTAPIFFGANDAILPVRMDGNGVAGLFLYVTHNGGTSWSLAPGFAPSYFTNRFDFTSINDGIAWDGASVFYATHNSGGSWTKVTPNVSFGDGLRSLDFVSTTTGWVYDTDENGNGALFRTTDGGRTWTKLYGNIVTPVPTPQPDLTITQMKIELQNTSCFAPGDPMGVRVWIKNNGQATALSFVVRVNGVDQTANALESGATTILFFPGYSNPVTALADATNTNAESDENNNSRSEMVPVPTPPLPCPTSTPATPPPSAADFAQTLVNTLNARDFNALPAMMDQTFGFAYWQSQGNSYPSDQAIESLRTGLTVTLVPNASQDLNALLGGLNPYAIMGLDPSRSYGLFVSGWGS
ncbi:MAG TPA: CARDB domain-containing protein, partial [Anaerolineales bacterium]|nr:CARDB domain-containing protein [Anaerolineales bacterium]